MLKAELMGKKENTRKNTEALGNWSGFLKQHSKSKKESGSSGLMLTQLTC